MANAERLPSPLVSLTFSPASLVGSMYSIPTISPEVQGLNETLAAMKGSESLGNPGSIFDTLGQQRTQMVQIGGKLDSGDATLTVHGRREFSGKLSRFDLSY